MPDAHKNLAASTVATAPSPATTGTSLVVASGDGAKFPEPPFNIIVWPAGAEPNTTNSEIVRVTAVATDTFTITRNADFDAGDADKMGGSARSILAGDQVAAAITARTFADIERPMGVAMKVGAMTVWGHSYLAGSAQSDSGIQNVWQEGTVSKLQALMGIHEDNVLNLSQAGATASGATNAYAGWKGIAQFVVPNNSAQAGAVGDIIVSDPVVATGGAGIIVHGINDLYNKYGAAAAWESIVGAFNRNAAKNAMRFAISRMRAGAFWAMETLAGTLTPPSNVTRSGTWANTAGVDLNSGSGYSSTTTATDYFEITIPQAFRGGTVAVAMIGQQNGWGLVSDNPLTSGATTVNVTSKLYLPSSGTFVMKIDSEEMLVTAHPSGTSFTVTRGVNGTSAASHNLNSICWVAQDTHKVTWSTNGTETSEITGDTFLGGQGGGLLPGPVVKRFRLTSASAGKTIRGTFSKVTSDTDARLIFDSWWIEAPRPTPIAVANLHHWNFLNATDQDVSSGQINAVVDFNSMIESLIAEFEEADGTNWVQLADVYTPSRAFTGRITSALNNTDVTSTGVGFTCDDTDFVPEIGMAMAFGFAGEVCTVTAVSGSAGSYTLSLLRAQFGSTKVAHSSGAFLGYCDWVGVYDRIHMNVKGHAVYAEHLYRALTNMPAPLEYQVAGAQGAWSQTSQAWAMGVRDDKYTFTPVTSQAVTVATTLNDMYFVPFYIVRPCILTEIGVTVATASSANGVLRFGIYIPDRTHAAPGVLLQDFTTTVACTTANAHAGLSGIHQMLRQGWYFLAVAYQASSGSPSGLVWRQIQGAGGFGQLDIDSLPSASTAVAFGGCGFKLTGQSGALPSNASALSPTCVGLTGTGNVPPRFYVRRRALQFA